jgi:hypothetical protein
LDINSALSTPAFAEKAQPAPHDNWFFTGVTLPAATQSMVEAPIIKFIDSEVTEWLILSVDDITFPLS